MKTTADGVPQVGEVQKVVMRSRARQGWMLLALVALLGLGAFGVRINRPKPVVLPAIVFASAESPSAGMVAQVLVQPGERVRRGELLAVLDFSHLQAQSEAAFDNVVAAAEEAPNSGPVVTVPLPPPGLTGSFEKRAVRIQSPLPPVNPSTIRVAPENNAPASATADTDLPTLIRKSKDLQSTIDAENKAIKTLQDKLAADADAATAAQSLVVSLTTVATRTKADADKAATLLAEGVISANDASKAQGYAQQAQGQLENAKISAAQAEATMGDTQRAIDSAQVTLKANQDALAKLQSQIADAKKHPKIVTRPLLTTPPPAPEPTPPTVKYKLQSVKGPIAPVGPAIPLAVDFATPDQIVQRIRSAEHELHVINRHFNSVCVYAPSDGMITKVAARPGQMVASRTVLFEIRR